MVEIKNLTKYYGQKAAVKNISFTVEDHEILGFLGPNGAGKSTTMNIICGVIPSSSGTVTINGFDIAKDPIKAKRHIGFLPEIPPVYPDMKVKEYLTFVAGLKGVPGVKRKAQVAKAMDRLRITDVAGRLIRNLSKGYRQRVGFAQALLGEPDVLILDEPTVGLDPEQVIEVRNLILELKQDHTIILSSHVLSEISAVCDRVVIISKGEIRAVDTISKNGQTPTQFYTSRSRVVRRKWLLPCGRWTAFAMFPIFPVSKLVSILMMWNCRAVTSGIPCWQLCWSKSSMCWKYRNRRRTSNRYSSSWSTSRPVRNSVLPCRHF